MFDPTQGLFFFFLLIHLFHRCVVGGGMCLSCSFLEYSDMFLCVYVVGFFFFGFWFLPVFLLVANFVSNVRQ